MGGGQGSKEQGIGNILKINTLSWRKCFLEKNLGDFPNLSSYTGDSQFLTLSIKFESSCYRPLTAAALQ